MKKNIITLAAIALALLGIVSCTHEGGINDPTWKEKKLTDPIVGRWEWIQTTGGIAGVYLTPANTNETKIMVLKDNGKFYYIINGQADEVEKYYQLKREMSWLLNSMADYIAFYGKKPPANPLNSLKIIYQYSSRKDTLYLIEEAADGFNHAFRRIR